MRSRGLVVLAIAVVTGLFAAYFVYSALQERSRPTVELQTTAMTTLVVARTRLDFGNKLEQAHLSEVKWPADSVPPGTYRTVDEVLKPGEDRSVIRAIEVGEPIFAAKISGSGQRATLSAIVDDSKRATTIRVNDIIGVAGFVLPGDRVDILLTRQVNDAFITDILLQNIHVLGVDQVANDRANEPLVAKAVTVEATPLETQKLTLAAQVGTLSLALRSEADTQAVSAQTIGLDDLRGGSMPVASPEPVIVRPIVRANRGDGSSASVKIYRSMQGESYKVRREDEVSAAPAANEESFAAPAAVEDLEKDADDPVSVLPQDPAPAVPEEKVDSGDTFLGTEAA